MSVAPLVAAAADRPWPADADPASAIDGSTVVSATAATVAMRAVRPIDENNPFCANISNTLSWQLGLAGLGKLTSEQPTTGRSLGSPIRMQAERSVAKSWHSSAVQIQLDTMCPSAVSGRHQTNIPGAATAARPRC